jgi:hypothetical protein
LNGQMVIKIIEVIGQGFEIWQLREKKREKNEAFRMGRVRV